ncbi:MAG TPA: hypothetical protein DCP90_00885 [Clostridiales bacterium]|nr:MAG: hypothetical protein A2Y22_07860 [Clostridiales bacterium GWD2_32_59]HAN09151.1 hypothetical protein [Clostridiales bacterium]
MKIKGLKRAVAIVIAISLICQGLLFERNDKVEAATSALSSLPVGARIMFGGRQFAVLNPSDGTVVSLKNITKMAFDPNNTQLYNPSDSNNLGYYLNNTYFNTFTEGEKELIKNSIWYTGNETNETASSVTTYIGLLRETEYNAAKAAGIFLSTGEYGYYWWLITPYSGNGTSVRRVASTGIVGNSSTSNTFGVRPAFKILESTNFEYDTYSGMYYYPGTLGENKTISTLNIGDAIMFHGEAWRVVTPSTGLIVSDRIVDARVFDPDGTQLYNPSDSNNLGYYLNNTYYNTFTAAEKTKIKSSTWYRGNETNETASSVTTYIGLLRETEYNAAKAAGIFPNTGASTYWWLITPYSVDSGCVRVADHVGGVTNGVATSTYGVRSAFQILETAIVNEVQMGVYAIDTTSPTADITYNPLGSYKTGTAVTITATFNEPVADSPVPRISISGANTQAAINMTKTSPTVYTYTHTVGAGDGLATVAMGTAKDIAGNNVTAAPTSGATFTVDNTPPAAPTFGVNPTTPTNDDVIVTITYPGDATIIEYQIDALGWLSYTGAITITTNVTVYARCYDSSGNPSSQSSLSIVNIDKTPPDVPTVNPATGTYNAAQIVTVSNSSIDVAHTYYTLDGSDPNETTPTEVIIGGTISVDGNDGETVTLKLVSYDGAENKGTIGTYQYTFNKTGPIIIPSITGRVKAPSDIDVDITIISNNLESWEYQWDADTTLDESNWIEGVIPTPQAITPQTANGTWYLHVRATDDDENIVLKTYGSYKKGTVSISEGYAEDTYLDERKWFKYYIGLDANNIGRVMLVAPKDVGGVKQIFTKDDVLDPVTHRFKVGAVYYIDRYSKIQVYN